MVELKVFQSVMEISMGFYGILQLSIPFRPTYE